MAAKIHDPGSPVPVAQVFVNLDTGGAERHALALLRHLDRRRFAPRVLCLSARGALAGAVEQLGVPVDCLHLDPRRLWTPAAQLQLVRWFRTHRIRIAHIGYHRA